MAHGPPRAGSSIRIDASRSTTTVRAYGLRIVFRRAKALARARRPGAAAIWRRTTGSIAADQITSRNDEIFYWVVILVSNTLGAALGDFTADNLGLGFQGGALLFTALIAVVAALHFFTRAPTTILFWAAYVLTRPLGATLGDTLTKPLAKGGFDLSRINSSLVIALMMVAAVWATERRQARLTREEAAA